MPTVQRLLGNGYLPKELPPCFTSVKFARFARIRTGMPGSGNPGVPTTSEIQRHYLARPSGLRRTLGIPNPYHHFYLVKEVCDKWNHFQAVWTQAHFSATTPFENQSFTDYNSRALYPGNPAQDRLESLRARHRSTSAVILRTDLTSYYASIYTHGIAWAIDGKAACKQAVLQRNLNVLIGHSLDVNVQNSQHGQTRGIPVGPDTSLAIGELILASLDVNLGAVSGFRYMDDYEFCFETVGQAEHFLGRMQSVLGEQELELNSRKTSIVHLPESLYHNSWRNAISDYKLPLSRNAAVQGNAILRYFDLLFDLAKKNPGAEVLSNGLGKFILDKIANENKSILLDLSLQCAVVELGAIRNVAMVLELLTRGGFQPRNGLLEEFVNRHIKKHVVTGNASEVLWALWIALRYNTTIDQVCAQAISGVDDPLVAIIALDLHQKGQFPHGFVLQPTNWSAAMSGDELFGDRWMLAYEGNLKGWLQNQVPAWLAPPGVPQDYVARNPFFRTLKAANVTFYEPTAPMFPLQGLAVRLRQPVSTSRYS